MFRFRYFSVIMYLRREFLTGPFLNVFVLDYTSRSDKFEFHVKVFSIYKGYE
jgi:hypothetical protein